MRARGRAARAAAIAALAWSAACSQSDDGEIRLPVAEAERVRELQMLVVPGVKQISREDYAADSERSAAEASEDDVHTQQDLYGRLGFFPRDFDLRATGRSTSAFYGAFYSQTTKDITVIDPPTTSLLVHELTHALQDQHFDLARLTSTSTSSDEALAVRALIEGDATVAEDRYVLQARNFTDPTAEVSQYVTSQAVLTASEKNLDNAGVPLLFAAHVAFAYSYGEAYVARRLGVVQGSWALGPVNALFAGRGPLSTQEILRGGVDVDPIVATGFSALPVDVAQTYAAEVVDRMGEWYTYLLLRPTMGASEARRLAAGWDGDQLILLRAKNGMSPPSTTAASAILWTTVWDTQELAREFSTVLSTLHGLRSLSDVPDLGIHAYQAADGEEVWLETRENQVFFSKSYDLRGAEQLANVVLSTREEKRMDVVNRFATQPIVHCLRREHRD